MELHQKQTFKTCHFHESRLSISRLEAHHIQKRRRQTRHIFWMMRKNKGLVYLNVEAWLLLALP